MEKAKMIFAILFVLILIEAGHHKKLLLTVFYASNSQDSSLFILQQLRPAMRRLHEHVKIQFVPFGKATSIDYGLGGFECPHGPAECRGNLVQDCTLYVMQKRTDMQRLKYVACEMATRAGSRKSLKCVTKAGVSERKVKNCIENGKGASLQLASENLTRQLDPKFIPTITIDKVFSQEVQDSAQYDLLGSLCHILTTVPTCIKYINSKELDKLENHPEFFFR